MHSAAAAAVGDAAAARRALDVAEALRREVQVNVQVGEVLN